MEEWEPGQGGTEVALTALAARTGAGVGLVGGAPKKEAIICCGVLGVGGGGR